MIKGQFEGKRVLVTGAGRGIGRAVAEGFGAQGAQVICCARTETEIQAVANGIGDGRGLAVPCDVGSDASVEACIAKAREAFGGIDILVNSAGISPSCATSKMSTEDWDRVLNVNLTGAFRVTRAVMPEMVERGWGRIIHMASVAGKSGMKYVSAYCASKHGVLGLVRATALELGPTGVTINAVCPGYVNSPMTDGNIQRLADRTGRDAGFIRKVMEDLSPQGRLMESDEIAAMTLYLGSEMARGINGQGINVCGGSVMS
jgi:NAD(P)-dependent dehydrogenase (short-subunit alcohol dehydrogenase family)